MQDEEKRPLHLEPPPYLSPTPPIPTPAEGQTSGPPSGETERLDPTRYGDWEKNGIAVDF
ncbi:MAG TPA: DUF1674 domain-containing protein [Sphingomicrobium sp.]|nr:DUF1674 domain-containing protein [Sphingomicrobium sp.]